MKSGDAAILSGGNNFVEMRTPCLSTARQLLISSTMTTFEQIRDDFAFLDEWDDRYKYLIDLGRNLDPYPEACRDEAHKVRGCASQVWLHATRDNDKIALQGDSDAHIVRGLVALLLALFSGKTPREILAIDPKAELSSFELEDHLTPQRSNGLYSMVNRIQAIASEPPA